jgi:hypothetical protein
MPFFSDQMQRIILPQKSEGDLLLLPGKSSIFLRRNEK